MGACVGQDRQGTSEGLTYHIYGRKRRFYKNKLQLIGEIDACGRKHCFMDEKCNLKMKYALMEEKHNFNRNKFNKILALKPILPIGQR